jgi:magnesium-transporting ATPase (P-type)
MAKTAPVIGRLEEYIGAFYEDELEAKIRSSKDILLLFQNFANIETLLEHGRCVTM